MFEDRSLYSKEAEESFVGTLVVYPQELILYRTEISADDIYIESARKIYIALCELMDENIDPSPPVVLDRCSVEAPRLAEIMKAAVMRHQLKGLAEIIKEDSRRRALDKLANDIALRVKDDFSSDDITSYVDDALTNIRADNAEMWISNRDLLKKQLEVIEERYNAGGVIGISTGFSDLDEHLGGLIPGNLIMLAAVPKAGKTSFALHMAMNSGVPTLFFTLEMLPNELMDRQLAIASKVPAKSLRTGKISSDAWSKLGAGMSKLRDLPLAFVWRSGLTVGDIRAICLWHKQKHGLGLVVIDQLDKIYEPAIRGENQATRIGRVTTGLKNLARDLEVPVVCLTQLLDKRIAGRDTKRPQHGDIRDSSYPDQDADVVLYLWRPALYEPDNERWKNKVEVIIARSRATAEGSVWVKWEPQYTKFSLLTKDDWPRGDYKKGGAR